MRTASFLGWRWTVLAFLVGLVLLGSRRARAWGMLGLVSLILPLGAVEILKRVVLRPRPWLMLADVRLLEGAKEPYHSFPSGHAAAAFGLAVLIALRFPKAALPALFAASLVAVARVYLGSHYPSDVVAGAVLGGAGTWLCARSLLRRFPEYFVDTARPKKVAG